MTQEQHPITPPPELVAQWCKERACISEPGPVHLWLATQAARWGADRELEACCEWFSEDPPAVAHGLRAARRPNLPSLKEQALAQLEAMERLWEALGKEPSNIIRCALEALPD